MYVGISHGFITFCKPLRMWLMYASEDNAISDDVVSSTAKFNSDMLTSPTSLIWGGICSCSHMAECDYLPPTIGALQCTSISFENPCPIETLGPSKQVLVDSLQNWFFKTFDGIIKPVTTNLKPLLRWSAVTARECVHPIDALVNKETTRSCPPLKHSQSSWPDLLGNIIQCTHIPHTHIQVYKHTYMCINVLVEELSWPSGLSASL